MRGIVSSFRTRFQGSLAARTAQLDSNTRQQLAAEVLDTNEQQQDDLVDIDGQLAQAKESLSKLQSNEEFLLQRLTSYQAKLGKQEEQLKEAEERATDSAHHEDTTLSHEQATLLHDEADGESSHANERFENEFEPLEVHRIDMEEDEDDEDEETGEVERNPVLHASPEERERLRIKLRDEQAALTKVSETRQTILDSIRQLRMKIMILEEKKRMIVNQTDECRDFVMAAAMADHAEASSGFYSYEDEEYEQDGDGHSNRGGRATG